jgi:hypothetical protein
MNGTDARFYVSILLRRLPYLAAIVSSALVLTVIVASVLPPRYRASAKILVEAPQIPVELARSTVPIQAALQMQIIRATIFSCLPISSIFTAWKKTNFPVKTSSMTCGPASPSTK